LHHGPGVEPFRLEVAHGSGEVLLGFAHASLSGERCQQRFVGAPVEGRYREPLLETGERLFALDARRKMLEQCRAAAAKAPALRREPTREGRAALDLEPLEEVAFEKRAERAKLLRCERREARLDRC